LNEIIEDINQAIKIVGNEAFMRNRIFARDPEKRTRKVAEMNFVKNILIRYKLDIGKRLANANKK